MIERDLDHQAYYCTAEDQPGPTQAALMKSQASLSVVWLLFITTYSMKMNQRLIEQNDTAMRCNRCLMECWWWHHTRQQPYKDYQCFELSCVKCCFTTPKCVHINVYVYSLFIVYV